jgi:hypothetical protein
LNSRRSPYFQSFRGDVNNLNCLIVVITGIGASVVMRSVKLDSGGRSLRSGEGFAMAGLIDEPELKA